MEFVLFIVGFVCGWYVSSKVTAAFYLGMFKMILTDLKITNKDLVAMARKHGADFITEEQEATLKAAEESDLERIEIKVEKHGDMLYAFRVDNDKFLGQGTDPKALITEMSHHIKNVHCTVVEGEEYMKAEA